MTTSSITRNAPASFIDDEVEHRRQLGLWAREAHQGHLANTGSLTLTANAGSTVLTDFRISGGCFIGLMPITANAATALSTTYISSRGKQTATITHTNDALTDKSFVYCILG